MPGAEMIFSAHAVSGRGKADVPLAAECPYFRYEKAGITHCECGNFIFPDVQTRREIVYGYCGHPENFRKCPFYIALEHHYERKEKW